MMLRLRSISLSLCSMMISSFPTLCSSLFTLPSRREICSLWMETICLVFLSSAGSASADSLRFLRRKKSTVPTSPLARMKLMMMLRISIRVAFIGVLLGVWDVFIDGTLPDYEQAAVDVVQAPKRCASGLAVDDAGEGVGAVVPEAHSVVRS